MVAQLALFDPHVQTDDPELEAVADADCAKFAKAPHRTYDMLHLRPAPRAAGYARK